MNTVFAELKCSEAEALFFCEAERSEAEALFFCEAERSEAEAKREMERVLKAKNQ
nr:hypothetical protein [Lysinibacillus timonensis]